MSQLAEIKNLAGYLTAFGKTLSRKAIHSLHPLHVPGHDPLPTFDDVPEHRRPFEAQAHLICGAARAMDNDGACFVVGEPGVGKTLCAILAIHEHACRPRKKGGKGGRYRAIIICPDHLITKWKDEIEDTIPGAIVHCWRPKDEQGTGLNLNCWPDFLKLMDFGRSETKVRAGDQPDAVHEASVSTGVGPHVNGKGELVDQPYPFEDCTVRRRPTSGKVLQHKKRWAKPVGPEWIILGRDQIKRQSKTSGLGQPRRCFDRAVREYQPSKTVVADRKPITDQFGDEIVIDGRVQLKVVTEKRMQCPRCGTIPTKKGVPLGPEDLKKPTHCQAIIFDEVGSADGKCHGRDRLMGNAIPYEHRNAKEGTTVKHAGKNWGVRICNEPLYQYTWKPRWWPPALIVQRRLRRLASYLVVDECHEQKAEDSEQSLAMGKILGTTEFCLALTGTFIGGYASHLFPLLIRMAARDMNARNFKWGSMADFIERYGCNDRIEITETVVDGGKKQGLRSSMAKRSSTKTEYKCRPGVMPTLFAEIVMPLAMFLKLDQFIDDLPGFEQRMVACELPAEIQEAYNGLQDTLVAANRELIAAGIPKLLGTMLWTLLSYPDYPWGWDFMFPYEGKETTPKYHENGRPIYSDGAPEHAVGWWQVPKVWTRDNYCGVVTPRNFDPKEIVLPKERELINLAKQNCEDGDQTWVYCEMTGKRDVMARLASLMEAEGLRVGVLRSGDVSPKERDVWIRRNGHLYDVMLSHLQLVATGLDLFNLHHGHYNFNHLVFYQAGYNLFRLRQAERRAWRIGQPKDCTVTYLYYKGTSQATALALMGRKAQAAQQLEEGTISDEGLAAMGGDAGAQAALVKALGEHIDPAEIQRNWSRVSGRGGVKRERKVRPVRPGAISLPVPDSLPEDEHIPPPGVASPLDSPPVEARIVGEAMVKASRAKGVDEALTDFRAWLATQAPSGEEPAVDDERRIPPSSVPMPLDHRPHRTRAIGEGVVVGGKDVRSPDDALADFRAWLSSQPVASEMMAVRVFEPEEEPESVRAAEDWRCPRCGGDRTSPSAKPGGACHKARHQARQERGPKTPPEPKRLEDSARDRLAAGLDAMRAGALETDDGDWR